MDHTAIPSSDCSFSHGVDPLTPPYPVLLSGLHPPPPPTAIPYSDQCQPWSGPFECIPPSCAIAWTSLYPLCYYSLQRTVSAMEWTLLLMDSTLPSAIEWTPPPPPPPPPHSYSHVYSTYVRDLHKTIHFTCKSCMVTQLTALSFHSKFGTRPATTMNFKYLAT